MCQPTLKPRGPGVRETRTNHPAIKVLHAALLGNVGRDAEVQEHVVEVGVLGRLEPAHHDKAAALVDGL